MTHSRSVTLFVVLLAAVAGCGEDSDCQAPREALIVVSPHPDDESILAAGTIHRRAADPNWYLRAIYVSGGDLASVPGDCNGIPEQQKAELIVELREEETRAAWRVLAPGRNVPIDFLRGPDQGLVESSTMVGGVRQDVLTVEGERVVEGVVELATQLPPSVNRVLFITSAIYDAHPDHRTAYRATRQAAEFLRRERQLDVRIWSFVVHDEAANLDLPICCVGDWHWPSVGPDNDYFDLTDVPGRPRPPMWNRVEDVSDRQDVRRDALAQHVSQVVGYAPLCMPVYNPSYYTRWQEKTEEPFYEEVL